MNTNLKFIVTIFIAIAVSCQQASKGLLEMGAIVIDDPREINKKALRQLLEYDAIMNYWGRNSDMRIRKI